MYKLTTVLLCVAILVLSRPITRAQELPPESGAEQDRGPEPLPAIDQLAADWERVEGFQPFYIDQDQGHIWFDIDEAGGEFLFAWGLCT